LANCFLDVSFSAINASRDIVGSYVDSLGWGATSRTHGFVQRLPTQLWLFARTVKGKPRLGDFPALLHHKGKTRAAEALRFCRGFENGIGPRQLAFSPNCNVRRTAGKRRCALKALPGIDDISGRGLHLAHPEVQAPLSPGGNYFSHFAKGFSSWESPAADPQGADIHLLH
jgi:hypothetical protein